MLYRIILLSVNLSYYYIYRCLYMQMVITLRHWLQQKHYRRTGSTLAAHKQKQSMKNQQKQHSDASMESDNKTLPSTSTIRYLRDRSFQQSMVNSQNQESCTESDRPNFCLNLQNPQYSVMRTYISAISQKQIMLYYTKFTPNIKKGQVCIVHGYGENTDDYLMMAEYFAKRGYVVHMIDMRGFGYSGGSRVNEPGRKILTDIETLMRNCCERDLRTFIVAYGLGAMFLNALLQQNTELPICGVINISPLLTFMHESPTFAFQRLLLRISPTIFNNLLIHNQINPTALVKDPAAIKQKIDSVFWESFITLRMADEYAKIGEKVKTEGYKFIYPILICVGGKDLVQDPAEIKKYYSSLSSQDKNLSVFRDGYHQLHNDYEADELMVKIYNWMESKRKNKVKWKQPKHLSKEGIFKRNKFWKWVGMFIAFLITLLTLIKKIRALLRK